MSEFLFSRLWINHPGLGDAARPETYPCDKTRFENQCAVRMGVALEKSGIDTTTFQVRRCAKVFPALRGHAPGHILAAQELADALDPYSPYLGREVRVVKRKGGIDRNSELFDGAKGIVFIQNGWGAVDHIDLWDGTNRTLRGAYASYVAFGQSVWFWQLA